MVGLCEGGNEPLDSLKANGWQDCDPFSSCTTFRYVTLCICMYRVMSCTRIADGVLVYVKGGVMDKIMYQFTLILCAVGLGLSGKVLYELSYPKKQ
ncbi:hypothetical protein ANN_21522 [Periplaneta americana]|uniref:Uncharacterized protein n=1 Tax=Periplaneta americana TaxID=6978 RepID=A0ABQ8SFJ0_PERAM|nr:hypothetical protein ANN_21522 [Periplaneta americana]